MPLRLPSSSTLVSPWPQSAEAGSAAAPAQVQDRLRKATFTSPADKGVVRINSTTGASLPLWTSRANLLGLDNRLVRRADAQMRLGTEAKQSERTTPAPSRYPRPRADHVARQQERTPGPADQSTPRGSDWTGPVRRLRVGCARALQFRADGDHESFVVGTVFVMLSIAVVWIIAVALLIVNFCEGNLASSGPDSPRRHTRNAMLLSPFNLHVLYLAPCTPRRRRKEVDNSLINEDSEVDDAPDILYFCFCICKVLETGLESIILEATAAAIFSPGGEGDSPLVLYLLLSLSVVSMDMGSSRQAWSDKMLSDDLAIPGRGCTVEAPSSQSCACRDARALALLGHAITRGCAHLTPFSLWPPFMGGAIAVSLFVYLLVLCSASERRGVQTADDAQGRCDRRWRHHLGGSSRRALEHRGDGRRPRHLRRTIMRAIIASGKPVDENPSDFLKCSSIISFLGTRARFTPRVAGYGVCLDGRGRLACRGARPPAAGRCGWLNLPAHARSDQLAALGESDRQPVRSSHTTGKVSGWLVCCSKLIRISST